MRAEGFSCSVDVLSGGLGISKLQFCSKKEERKVQLFLFQFLVIKTLDPDPYPDSLEMLNHIVTEAKHLIHFSAFLLLEKYMYAIKKNVPLKLRYLPYVCKKLCGFLY